MRNIETFILISVLLSFAHAQTDFCTVTTHSTVGDLWYGYALGTQDNTGDTTTTCAQFTASSRNQIDAIGNALRANTGTDSVLQGFQNGMYFVVAYSDQMIACKDSAKIKNLDTRLNELSGAFNMVGTAAWAVVAKQSFNQQSPLYDAFVNAYERFN